MSEQKQPEQPQPELPPALPDDLRATLTQRLDELRVERARAVALHNQLAQRIVELGGQISEIERLIK